MVYPHTDPNHANTDVSPERRKRHQSKTRPPHTGGGVNVGKSSGSGGQVSTNKARNDVDLPDGFCNFFKLKRPEQWSAFLGYAKSYDTFRSGLVRLMEILLTGDEQDKKIFSLLPLEIFSQWDIQLELEGCKDEYTKDGKLTLGSRELPWRRVTNDIIWNKDPSITGLVKFRDIEKIKDPKEKADALARKAEIEKHPVVLEALNWFSGEIIGYKVGEDEESYE